MSRQIVAVTLYPILDQNSVRFLKKITARGGVNGGYCLQLTKDPGKAQKFNAEIHAVVNWLSTLDTNQDYILDVDVSHVNKCTFVAVEAR